MAKNVTSTPDVCCNNYMNLMQISVVAINVEGDEYKMTIASCDSCVEKERSKLENNEGGIIFPNSGGVHYMRQCVIRYR